MLQKSIAYAMVKSAVEKGIREIREDPGRGVRKLADLGELFAGGRFQRELFQAVHRQLKIPGSAYYRLAERIVNTADPVALTALCMSLGYNCWSQGARFIRAQESRGGSAIPWCLPVRMRSHLLDLSAVTAVVRQGKALGIYAYLFFIEASDPSLDKLVERLRYEPDCAFLLFLSPRAVSDELAGSLRCAKTVWTNLDLDGGTPEQVRRSVELLRQNRCFCGGFFRYGDFSAQVPAALTRADALRLPSLMLMDTKGGRPGPDDDRLTHLRRQLPCPVFPIGMNSDILRMGRNSSPQVCLTVIDENGGVLAVNDDGDELPTGMRVPDTPLGDVLRRCSGGRRPGSSQQGLV